MHVHPTHSQPNTTIWHWLAKTHHQWNTPCQKQGRLALRKCNGFFMPTLLVRHLNSTSSGLYRRYHLCLSQLIFREAWNSVTTWMLQLLHAPYLQLLIIWQIKDQTAFMLNMLRPLHVAVAAVITTNAILLQFKLSLLTNKCSMTGRDAHTHFSPSRKRFWFGFELHHSARSNHCDPHPN